MNLNHKSPGNRLEIAIHRRVEIIPGDIGLLHSPGDEELLFLEPDGDAALVVVLHEVVVHPRPVVDAHVEAMAQTSNGGRWAG